VPVKEDGLPYFDSIVVAVDPSGSRRGDEAGIVAAGKFTLPGGKVGAVVLEDLSSQMSPKLWAQEAVTLHRRLGANKLLCERNFGGELVEDNIKGYPGAPSVTMVSVTNGKIVRAEPIQQRYESGLVWHAKRLPNLEAQMTDWHPKNGMPSPGALDAAVIALSSLFGIADHIRVSGSGSWESLASQSEDLDTDDADDDTGWSGEDSDSLSSSGWGNW
jgi:phage terminase large subunit-like protein